MFKLVIILIATTLQHPKPHQVLRVSLPYDTQYTCDKAETRLDADVISRSYNATHKGSKVTHVETDCERNHAVEPSQLCEWQLFCSNTIHKI